MSTLEVKEPYTTGAPGRTSLRQRDARQCFGVLQHQGAGHGDRGHRAGQGKRGDDGHLPGFGKVDDALAHGNIELTR